MFHFELLLTDLQIYPTFFQDGLHLRPSPIHRNNRGSRVCSLGELYECFLSKDGQMIFKASQTSSSFLLFLYHVNAQCEINQSPNDPTLQNVRVIKAGRRHFVFVSCADVSYFSTRPVIVVPLKFNSGEAHREQYEKGEISNLKLGHFIVSLLLETS